MTPHAWTCMQLKAVDGVVNDVEKTLKIISDDLLFEHCERQVACWIGVVDVYCCCLQ